MIRSFFKLVFFFLLVLLFIMMAFSAGWITIVIDGDEIRNDIRGRRNHNLLNESEYPHNSNEDRIIGEPNRYIEHVLRPGENLIELERLYTTDWREIQRVNHVNDPYEIMPGTLIYIPIRSNNRMNEHYRY